MKATALGISGAWLLQSDVYADERGTFSEWFKHSELLRLTGESFSPVQANVSVSQSGVVRGIHYSLAPQGQAKLVTVMSGAITDVIIDLRTGSPTYGQYRSIEMHAGDGQTMFIRHDLAHAFQALTDNTVVSYLVSSEYSPNDEKEITPLCPILNIQWSPDLPVVLSDKDRQAPGIEIQKQNKLLPKYKAS